MKMTKTKRQSVAKSQKVVDIIKKKLAEKSNEVKNGVNLANIAKDLADRRERILSRESSESSE